MLRKIFPTLVASCTCLLLAMSSGCAFSAENQLLVEKLETLPPFFALEDGQVRPDEIKAFYAAHGFRPVWKEARLAALRHEIAQLADDGLNPQHYTPPALTEATAQDETQRIAQDMLATVAYLQALHDVRFGALPVAQRERLWRTEDEAEREANTATRERERLFADAASQLDDLAGAFQRARPPLDTYHRLRAQYAQMRQQPAPSWPRIPEGTTLRPGQRSARVPLLRQRLLPEDTPDSASADRLYDPQLVAAVKAFQQAHGLNADGNVGQATREALNVSYTRRQQQLRANLERIRWLATPDNLLNAHIVLANIPEATVRYVRDGQTVWQARVQVGQRSRATPPLRSEIEQVTLNPTWTVPPTILKEDKLPLLRTDPEYLVRHNMRVFSRDGRELDSASIDWNDPPPGILLRQDAGAGNALGQAILRFANPFAIYLHDTPSKRLFAQDQRATSSGCVRVEHIVELVRMLLEDTGTMQNDELRALLASGKTHKVELLETVPILIAYWTADVADNDDGGGALRFLPDVYQRDAPLIELLNAAENRHTRLPLYLTIPADHD